LGGHHARAHAHADTHAHTHTSTHTHTHPPPPHPTPQVEELDFALRTKNEAKALSALSEVKSSLDSTLVACAK